MLVSRYRSLPFSPRPDPSPLVQTLFIAALLIQLVYTAALYAGFRRARRIDPLSAHSDPRAPLSERSTRESSPLGSSPLDSSPPGSSPPGSSSSKAGEDVGSLPPVTIVVAVHNEVETLPDLLEALSRQTHPHLEIVVVDDASTDATATILDEWVEAGGGGCATRRVVRTDGPPRKKSALERGVAAARHELLACTDADCTPPPRWAEHLARAHAATTEPSVLIGYSPFRRADGFLGRWSRYETMLAGTYAAAAAGLERPYMAVGRNLSYPASVFEKAGGFSEGSELLSGDDDLFVQSVARHGAARILPLLHPDTFVEAREPSGWKAWIRGKRRHVSAGRAYDPWAGLHLTLYHASHVALWAAPLLVGSLGVGLLAMRLVAHGTLVAQASETLDDPSLAPLFPLGEAFYALYHVLLVPIGLLSPPSEW